jgi:2-C-methyl-D-erythritol 4-phosphate cytidylyltransferase
MDVGAITAFLDGASGADCAVLTLPIKSSIKRIASGVVVDSVERTEVRRLQSPWFFRRATFETAMTMARDTGMVPSTELDLVRAFAIPVRLVTGNLFNVPIVSEGAAKFAELALSANIG